VGQGRGTPSSNRNEGLILFHIYFGEPPKFQAFGVMGQSKWLIAPPKTKKQKIGKHLASNELKHEYTPIHIYGYNTLLCPHVDACAISLRQ
jgi:hypothetical protein